MIRLCVKNKVSVKNYMAKIIKKAAVKKAVKKATKKAPAKKVVVKKVAPKKSAVKKVATKKTVVKKIATKKVVVKKSAVKKVVAKKAAVKKVVAKKEVVKKVAPKKEETKLRISNPLLDSIIDGLEERKAKNITILDLSNIKNRSFDYFVIADAESSTHVDSIASSVEETVKKQLDERPFHTEGWENAEWILLDYVDIMVHVFQQQTRDFYRLEELWADAEITRLK
jgi:ribosome-associated protein